MVQSKTTLTIEDLLQETLAALLKNLGIEFRRFKVTVEENYRAGAPIYRIDIDTDEASTLIGYHGETIYALQHMLKTLMWKKNDDQIFIILDVDGYRKRQEESVVLLALKKVELLRKTAKVQMLPAMSPYFRRVVHLAIAKPEYDDIMTESIGEGDDRAVAIKLKSQDTAE